MARGQAESKFWVHGRYERRWQCPHHPNHSTMPGGPPLGAATGVTRCQESPKVVWLVPRGLGLIINHVLGVCIDSSLPKRCRIMFMTQEPGGLHKEHLEIQNHAVTGQAQNLPLLPLDGLPLPRSLDSHANSLPGDLRILDSPKPVNVFRLKAGISSHFSYYQNSITRPSKLTIPSSGTSGKTTTCHLSVLPPHLPATSSPFFPRARSLQQP